MARFVTTTSSDGKLIRTWNLDHIRILTNHAWVKEGERFYADGYPLEECEYKTIMQAIETLQLRGR